MKHIIADITELKSGVFARPEPDGELFYLQARHFDEGGTLTPEIQPEIRQTSTIRKHVLKHGDVLFAAKGFKNFAAAYTAESPAVASPTFIVMKVKTELVKPEYLAWALNTMVSSGFFTQYAFGSSLPSISMAALRNIPIDVPSLSKQETILEAAKLAADEKRLRLRIAELREIQIRSILQHIAK